MSGTRAGGLTGGPDPNNPWFNNYTLTRHRDTYPFIDPFRFRHTLTGRIVVVTGAHRGLGKASALAFAAAGASVACVGRPEKLESVISEIKERHGTRTLAIAANFKDPAVPDKVVQLVEQNLGPIDILVIIESPSIPASFEHETDFLNNWWSSVERNLKTPIALIKAVLPFMISRGQGTIISSTGMSVVQVPFTSANATANGGLINFHQMLDYEVRPKGVYSYVVHPGIVASYIHDPDGQGINPEHFAKEPRMRAELTERIGTLEWSATGLAAGTFVALSADERCKCLSGKYINAENDLGEVITEAELGPMGRIDRERLYILKVDEL